MPQEQKQIIQRRVAGLVLGQEEPRALGGAQSQEARVGVRGREGVGKGSRQAVSNTRLWQGAFSVGGPRPHSVEMGGSICS